MATKRKARAALAPKTARAAGGLRILVLSGPNLDRLGKREPEIYGRTTLAQIHEQLEHAAEARGAQVDCRQSNYEGELIDWIGAASDDGFAGILLNPGALTHSSYALFDAIKGSPLPTIEVHISNPETREEFRKTSLVAPACVGKIAGFGAASYGLALLGLLDRFAS
ncbi:MAG TPA: type II 3-dehydroquinate dehydratase [Polyangiaceae bacterium]|jgi:3-dehydroquinate dehydratase-2|nr:type II 3-dehydroquinate dehydratase [Polyangiaceae bacterium]